jgi:hypothetical protein
MLAKSGLDRPPKLPSVRSELTTKVLAIVLVVELLRKRCSDQWEVWRLLEWKVLEWLNTEVKSSWQSQLPQFSKSKQVDFMCRFANRVKNFGQMKIIRESVI